MILTDIKHMAQQKTTEASSHYDHLESMSIRTILEGINTEDHSVPEKIKLVLPHIEALVEKASAQLNAGGRLFYLGAGTSGRLGIVDASECPPTFGVPHGLVVGIMAGGDTAIRKAVEFAEDDLEQGWKDLQHYDIDKGDFVIGIAASGSTPYVIGALDRCQQEGIPTGCITCNSGSKLASVSDFPIEVVVGPEFVTGSTRMKAGTAQKLVLNMISTACMIQMGRVKGNKMVDMQLSNNKLVDRGSKMVMEALGVDYHTAQTLLLEYGSVRNAVTAYHKNK